jgi:hypothetical protein
MEYEEKPKAQKLMPAPWNTCGLCEAHFNSWPHRNNHYKKNHPEQNPKDDHTDTGLAVALAEMDAQDAAWESELPALDDEP